MKWIIHRDHELVTIYDSMDSSGNGNVRFKGTVEAALSAYCFVTEALDVARKISSEQADEIVRLTNQLRS
jgi:hypothetical protein